VQARTFVVTVSDSPRRVVVEDVRSRRRTVGTDLAEVGRQIAELLEAHSEARDGRPGGAAPS
jgi:hypothetical protein